MTPVGPVGRLGRWTATHVKVVVAAWVVVALGLGFEPQGFLDAWAPVLFFAMIFAISMDYTVFLLSSAKEHGDRSHDPLSGPLPPKEMGVILGVAVLLDAAFVRLLLMPVLLRLLGRSAWWLPTGHSRWLPSVRFGTGGASSPEDGFEVDVAVPGRDEVPAALGGAEVEVAAEDRSAAVDAQLGVLDACRAWSRARASCARTRRGGELYLR